MKKEDFEQKVNFELLGEPEQLINEFIEYWTETPLNGGKMRFEKEKFFVVKKRFNTWRKNDKKWNKPTESEFPLINAINQMYAANND